MSVVSCSVSFRAAESAPQPVFRNTDGLQAACRDEIPVPGIEIWRRQARHEWALRLIELPARDDSVRPIRAGRGRPVRRSSHSTSPSALR